MTMTEPPDAPLVVAAFLARYFADQAAGTLRSREDYEVLFPGYAPVVAAEYDRLQKGEDRHDEVEGELLAGYRIVRELGRGGQGIVYLAEDQQLERQVALKVLPGAFSATVARQRLLREAQAASRLDDPGICTVYDAGEQDGVAFIAMRYVDGVSLHERIEAERQQAAPGKLSDALRIKELLGTFEAVLRSLHRAHEKGLVHRDLKPSNLMISSDGTPMILDFGLAAFDDHPDGSLTGEVALGTPAYMSPEQLTAREGRVDARSDVFSLAVTLYEAIALVHPFDAPTRERLYQHILQDEAPALRKLVPGLPRDLDVVLQCALSKERARRYASALAFAEDLRSVRLHEPIQARKVSSMERAARWAQRNPLIATLATVLVVATLVFTVLTVRQNRELTDALASTNAARSGEQESLARERAARERAQALYLVGLSSAQLAEDPELALLLAREGRQRLDHHLTRSTLRAALEEWQPRPIVAGLPAAHWVDVSPDGARVAIDAGSQIVICDSKSRESIAKIPCADSRYAEVWWSGDSQQLLVVCANRLMHLVGGKNGEDEVVEGLLDVHLHNGTTGEVVAELSGHRGKVTAVAFAGNWLVTGDGSHDATKEREGKVRVWQVASGELHLELPDCNRGVGGVRFVGGERANSYPDVDVLSRAGVYRRVQGKTGKVLDERSVMARDAHPTTRAFLLQPGKVCVDDGSRVQIFDARTKEPPAVIEVDGGSRELLPCGALVSRTSSQSVSLVDVGKQGLRVLPMPPREIVHVGSGRHTTFEGSFFRNTVTTMSSSTVHAVFADGSMRSWTIGDGTHQDVPPIGGGVKSADLSSDGHIAATIDPEGRVRVFEVWRGSALPTWRGARISPWEAAHPNGRSVVTFRRDEAVLVDLADGSEVWAVDPSGPSRHCFAAFSPDGELCALGSDEGAFQIVRVADGEILLEREETGHSTRQLSFDPSGRYLGIVRQEAQIWDVRERQLVHSFDDVPMVANLMFADGGNRVVLGHTMAYQVRSLPGGELIVAVADKPWTEGVAAAVAGPLVLITRMHESHSSRVGGLGRSWVLDTHDATRVQIPGDKFGRGGLSPDGRLAVAPHADGSVDLFDRAGNRLIRSLRGHDRLVNRVRFSSDSSVFVTGYASNGFVNSHDERRVCVWTAAGELLQQIEFERSGVCWLDLSADGEWVLVKTNDGDLRRYPVRPLQLVEQLSLRDFTEAERERFEIR